MIQSLNGTAGFRLCLAILLAPLVPLAIVYLMPLLLERGESEDYGFKFFALLYLPFSYGAVFFVALPLFLFLRQRGMLNIPLMTVAGGLVGVLVWGGFTAIFSYLLDSSSSFKFSWLNIAWGIGLGVSIALPFSLIAGVPLFSFGRQNG